MACVYWIRLPEHTDIASQGYIGFTKQLFNTRMTAHRNAATQNKSHVICRSIRKYGWDNLVKSVLCIGADEYCLALEKQLRPSEHIGWNIGVGGGAAFLGCKHSDEARKTISDKSKGRPKSLEARKRMSLAKKGTVPTLEARKNMSAAAKLRGFAESHKANISKAKKGVPNQSAMKWKAAQADARMWLQACEIYDLCQTKNRRWTSKQLKQFGTAYNLHRLKKQFKRGWNPHIDAEYQAWKAGFTAQSFVTVNAA